MRYPFCSVYWGIWKKPASVLMVWWNEPGQWEEASRSRGHQTQRQQPGYRRP